MQYTMTPIIAKRELTRTSPRGTQTVVEVSIGTPTPRQANHADSDWYCPVQIIGLDDPRKVRPAFGADSMQALTLALKMAGMLIATSSAAREIEGHEANFGFPI